MSFSKNPGPDDHRTGLRTSVSRIEQELARLPRQTGDEALRLAWDQLVAQLALGPEPAVRNCPSCDAVAMLEATRCSNCWNALVPPR